jgi:predicted metalloendopeptidase
MRSISAQSGLGLPDRDYYLKKDDAKMASALAKYELHVAKILAGRRPQAAANAKKIVALETALAEVQWTKVENRDPVKRYNKMDIKQLAELAPGYDWGHALAQRRRQQGDYVIVSQPSYLSGFNACWKRPTWPPGRPTSNGSCCAKPRLTCRRISPTRT